MIESSQVRYGALFDPFSFSVAFDDTEVSPGAGSFLSEEYVITITIYNLFIVK